MKSRLLLHILLTLIIALPGCGPARYSAPADTSELLHQRFLELYQELEVILVAVISDARPLNQYEIQRLTAMRAEAVELHQTLQRTASKGQAPVRSLVLFIETLLEEVR